jgi:hypothetical protein
MIWWLVPAVIVIVSYGLRIFWTAQRLDRLHARVDAAGAALDAQLVRRAAALLWAAEAPVAVTGLASDARAQCEDAARAALEVPGGVLGGQAALGRQAAENAVGSMLAVVAQTSMGMHPARVGELREVIARVQVARRFFNDAVRDTRSLRSRRMVRILRLAGHRHMPEFFDIDDTIAIPNATSNE